MTISTERIQKLAQSVARSAFHTLVGETDIDRLTALEAAKDAGDRFAVALDLSLREHGVTITEENVMTRVAPDGRETS